MISIKRIVNLQVRKNMDSVSVDQKAVQKQNYIEFLSLMMDLQS